MRKILFTFIYLLLPLFLYSPVSAKMIYHSNSADELRSPLSGNYDIGGGNNNFPSIIAAVDTLTANGMSGSVIFNVYDGTYTGCAYITSAISGLGGGNSLTIQAAPGQTPFCQSYPDGYYCFSITEADNITIKGLTIDGWSWGIGIYGSLADSCCNLTIEDNKFTYNPLYYAYGGLFLQYVSGCNINGNTIEHYATGMQIDHSINVIAANNMLFAQGAYGIYANYLANCGFYYNAVLGESYCAIFNYCEPSVIFKNNILKHTGSSGWAIQVYYNTITSDYNDLYSIYHCVGNWNGNYCYYLPAWQSYSGLDIHSLSWDPHFISSTNLHIDPFAFNYISNAGTPIAGITADIDGDLRSSTNPDMGCDEYICTPPIPMSGSYDIGGGNNNFTTIIGAVDTLELCTMSGPVTFNVYSGTYTGQITITDSIPGLGAPYSLTIQAAPGQTPLVYNYDLDYRGFYLHGADNVTIRGFTIDAAGFGIEAEGLVNDSCTNLLIENNHFLQTQWACWGCLYFVYVANSQVSGNIAEGNINGIILDYSSEVLVANNMAFGQTNCSIGGSYLVNCYFYYNSTLCPTYAASFSSCDASVQVMNNIFKHTGESGTALYLASGSITSDYNNIYSVKSSMASYMGNACNHLYYWQTYSGQDAHSVCDNPRFISSANLHIDPNVLSWVSGTGTPIAGINTDFDGDARSPLNPDMGADEYTLIPPVPMSGVYDIGGGDFDFYTIKGAVDTLRTRGMGGPVTFEAYTGTYAATVHIDQWIPGLGASNPLVIQNAPGEFPNIYWWEWGNIQGFEIICADYITIIGFAIDVLGTNINVYGTPGDYCEHITIDNCYFPGGALPFVQNGMCMSWTRDFKILNNQIYNVPRGFTLNSAEDGVVANNRFSSNNYFTLYGLNASACSNVEFHYNSFLMGGGYSAAIADEDSTLIFKNNILFQLNTGAFPLSVTPSVTSDYNCFYSYDGAVVYYGTGYYGLPSWQAAYGQDMHSVFGNPQYTADMHIDPYVISPVSNAGIPVVSVTNDMDNDIRSTTVPDIGADEYFFIGQYGVLLTPEDTTGTDTTGNTIYYPFYVANTGTMLDSYYLTITGTEWTAAVYDAPGGSIISAAANLDPGDTVCVYVGHSVPAGIPEEFNDSGLLIAASQSSASIADTSAFTTNAIIWPPVQGEIVPDSTNIVIPSQGGTFTFNYTVTNYDQNNPYLVRIWKSVDMPNGQNINLFAITINVPPALVATRHVTQVVPMYAPAGIYSYHIKIMFLPDWEVWDDDSLTFVKEAGDQTGGQYQEWQTLGWEDEPEAQNIPIKYNFAAPSPNPFNPQTMLCLDLPAASKIELVIYNVSGRMVGKVVEGFYNAGSYKFAFDASNLPSGIYFARLQTGNYTKTQKLILLK